MLSETLKRPLRSVKYGLIAKLSGAHGASAVCTSIPHGERTWEYPWVLQTIGALAQGRKLNILDVGSGPVSILPLWVSSLGHSLWACDLRASAVRFPGEKFVVADITEDVPELPLGYFDVAMAISVIEHVGLGHYGESSRDDQKAPRFLASMAKYVKPGGNLVLTLPFGRPARSNQDRIDAYRVRNLQETRDLCSSAGLAVVLMDCVELNGGHWNKTTPEHVSQLDSSSIVQALCGIILAKVDE